MKTSKLYKSLVRLRITPFRIKINGLIIYFPIFSEAIALYEEIFERKIYDIELIDPKCIIDVGSNIGISVLYFANKYPNAAVICFEPSDIANKFLKKNIIKNNLEKITFYNYAAGQTERNTILYSNNYGETTATLIKPIHSINQTSEVILKKLSSYITFEVDLLKIDTEGSEFEILQDLIDNNKLDLVKNFIIEFHDLPSNEEKMHEILKLMSLAGFSFRKYNDNEIHTNIIVFCEKR
jgi:FkbM family methyltransferase